MSAFNEQVGGNHYATFPISPSEFIYVNKLNWYTGNAIKYLCRHDKKHGAEDLKKAIHYARLLLEREYKVRSNIIYECIDKEKKTS